MHIQIEQKWNIREERSKPMFRNPLEDKHLVTCGNGGAGGQTARVAERDSAMERGWLEGWMDASAASVAT